MELNEIAMVEDPEQVVGWGSYRYTEDELAASVQAIVMAIRPWERSRIGRFMCRGGWALMLAALIFIVYLIDAGRPGPVGRNFVAISTALVLTLATYQFVWSSLHDRASRIRAAFRAFPLADQEIALAFTPDRYVFQSSRLEASDDWSFLQCISEFRDGFVLQFRLLPTGYWLPDHALRSPFDHEKAAAFLKSRGVKYRVIDRSVGSSHDRSITR